MMKNIPEPKERQSGYYDYFVKGQLMEGKATADVPRWIRGDRRQSGNTLPT
jgi:hypothetical protein